MMTGNPKPQPRTWQGYLEEFRRKATTQGFVDFVARLTTAIPNSSVPQFSVTYSLVLSDYLCRGLVLATAQTGPSDVAATLERIRKAAHAVRFDRRAPKDLDHDMRRAYAPVVKSTGQIIQQVADLMAGVCLCYVRGEYDRGRTADDVWREACGLSLEPADLDTIVDIESEDDLQPADKWRDVGIRGVGRLERAMPVFWLPPLQESDLEGEEEAWREALDAAGMGDWQDDLDRSLLSPDEEDEWLPPAATVVQPFVNENKAGRNDPGPCGSGKKYRHCHGKNL